MSRRSYSSCNEVKIQDQSDLENIPLRTVDFNSNIIVKISRQYSSFPSEKQHVE